MKFKGFAGMDRSGSLGNLPSVIGVVISENKADIQKCYQSIRKIAVKINPIFISRGEIKSKDFNAFNSRLSAIKEFEKHKIRFYAFFANRDFFELFKQYKNYRKYMQKIEAILWFECLRLSILNSDINPQVVFLDETFSGDDQEIFISVIRKLCAERLMFVPVLETVSSRLEDTVKLADLIAGFFKADQKIQEHFGKYKKTIDVGMIKEYASRIISK